MASRLGLLPQPAQRFEVYTASHDMSSYDILNFETSRFVRESCISQIPNIEDSSMKASNATSPPTARLRMSFWIIRAAVAFVFISSGLEKFSIGPAGEWIRMFAMNK
jgi:hypothetical protein